ncbi:MAG: hypothetical protein JWP81_3901 [Ferruginibacter sp.]|nr:hypothetical protein [Ferruginibacter sp.]
MVNRLGEANKMDFLKMVKVIQKLRIVFSNLLLQMQYVNKPGIKKGNQLK